MYNSGQLGYFDKGLGVFVYHDGQPQGAQMGNIFNDAWGAITGSVETAAQRSLREFEETIKDLPGAARQAAMSEFLSTPTGMALEAEAKKGWIDNQIANIRTVYLKNESMIKNIALGGAVLVSALVAYKIFNAGKSSGVREVVRVREVTPAQAMATNPRKKRKKRKSRSRRK